MSTLPETPPRRPATAAPSEVAVYMHSDLLYWWPVWAVGFAMAAWTAFGDRHVAVLPHGATVEGSRIVTPDGSEAVLLPLHVSPSRVPGAVFTLTLLAVLAFGTGWMRGWRAFTFLAAAAAAALLVSTLDAWDDLWRWVAYLHVHINLGGYLVLSSAIGVLWAWQFAVADRWTYVVFSPSQVRVQNEIGDEERVYDTGGLVFEKRPYDWFRYVFGFGAGDIRMRVGGAQGPVIELANVPHVHRQLRRIQALLRTKDVE